VLAILVGVGVVVAAVSGAALHALVPAAIATVVIGWAIYHVVVRPSPYGIERLPEDSPPHCAEGMPREALGGGSGPLSGPDR
jgi:hypothetical protein